MVIKLTITQLLMGLFEKIFRLHNPQTPSLSGKVYYFKSPKGPGSNGLISFWNILKIQIFFSPTDSLLSD